MLVVGGVVATGVALAVYRSALSDLDKAARSTTYQDVIYLEERAHSKRTISVVPVTTGSAIVAAGILHYALRSDTSDGPALGIALARGDGMVTYARRF